MLGFKDPSYMEMLASALTITGYCAMCIARPKARDPGLGGLGLCSRLLSCGCSTSSFSRRRFSSMCRVSWMPLRRSFMGTSVLMDWEGCAPCSKMRPFVGHSFPSRGGTIDPSQLAAWRPSPQSCGGFSTSPLLLARPAPGWIGASWLLRPCSTQD
jgi:hypothetical protein